MGKKGNVGGGLSPWPEDGIEGGGTEGAIATITEIDCVQEFTYGGRFKDKPSAALRVVFHIPEIQKHPEWEQHYSFGPSANYEVIEDGDGIRSIKDSKGLNKRSPAFAFLAAVSIAAEKSEIDRDELITRTDEGFLVSGLRDRKVKLTSKELETVGGDMKEYLMIDGFEDDTDSDEDDAKSVKPNGNTSASRSKNKPSSSEEIEEKTITAIEALIEEKTSVKKSDLANLVYQNNKKDPDAKAMMQLAFKESFIADEDRPWTYDKKRGQLKAED